MRIAKFTIIDNFFLSFKHGKEGYSARKSSTFACLVVAFFMIFFDKIPEEHRINAFYALLVTGLLCLGLVTIPQLIEILSLKKPANENNEPK